MYDVQKKAPLITRTHGRTRDSAAYVNITRGLSHCTWYVRDQSTGWSFMFTKHLLNYVIGQKRCGRNRL